ncbi:hypothetical protein CBS147332_2485 [Penicillium roqueforti]|nr:hypothetical protein CBS147332_2485 [Penicillium roqueforti]KAI3110002.1 hypothetical protein CBS147331_5431 [Penicillium roqueforti]
METPSTTAIRLANQLHVYIDQQNSWCSDFDSETKHRIDVVLSHQTTLPALPRFEDPYPPSWPIDRPSLHKATTAFLKATAYIPATNIVGTEPTRPLGRKAPPRRSDRPESIEFIDSAAAESITTQRFNKSNRPESIEFIDSAVAESITTRRFSKSNRPESIDSAATESITTRHFNKSDRPESIKLKLIDSTIAHSPAITKPTSGHLPTA